MKTTFIYALKDPETGRIRYIGKSDSPQKRLYAHLCDPVVCHRTNWLRDLVRRGLSPSLEILVAVEGSEWVEWEKRFIKTARAMGMELVNQTEGGESPMSGKRHSEETRRGMSERGRNRKPFFAGKKHSLRSRKKMSVSRTGVPKSLASRLASSEAQRGVPKPAHLRSANRVRVRRNNTSGFVGVTWYPKNRQWGARVAKPGVGREFLGLFDSAEEAGAARAAAMQEYYGS